MVIVAISQYKKINFSSFENFIKPGAQMQLCNEIMNAMLVLKFSKHNTYNFQKVFDFSDFSKFEKSRDVTLVDLDPWGLFRLLRRIFFCFPCGDPFRYIVADFCFIHANSRHIFSKNVLHRMQFFS